VKLPALSTRTKLIAAAVAVLCVVGGVYAWRRGSPVKETTQKVETVSAETEKVGADVHVVREAGPVVVTRRKVTPTPAGDVITETRVERAPVKTTTDSSVDAERTKDLSVKSETTTVEKPAASGWWVRGSVGLESKVTSLDLRVPVELAVRPMRELPVEVYGHAEVRDAPVREILKEARVGVRLAVEF
jgi:hypothetical protein